MVASDNLSSHGHVTIGEAVTDYGPTGVNQTLARDRKVMLGQNRPNPAVGRSIIAFTLGDAGRVRLTLHDVAGRQIRLLTNHPKRVAALEGFGISITEHVPIAPAKSVAG